jgi:hypothetical protein
LPAWLIYGGDKALTNENISIVPWKNISKLSVELDSPMLDTLNSGELTGINRPSQGKG